MSRILLIVGSFFLMLLLPTFIKTPEGVPYLQAHTGPAVYEPFTYTHPYHEMMKAVSAGTSSKSDTVSVYAWQDSQGNMHFTDKPLPTYQHGQELAVTSQHNGRFAFPDYQVWAVMLATWFVLCLLGYGILQAGMKLFNYILERPRARPAPKAATKQSRRDAPQKKAETSPRSPTPHQVLGVAETASADEIRSAYRKKIRDYHPDRVAHLGDELQATALQKSAEINQAYQALQTLKVI